MRTSIETDRRNEPPKLSAAEAERIEKMIDDFQARVAIDPTLATSPEAEALYREAIPYFQQARPLPTELELVSGPLTH